MANTKLYRIPIYCARDVNRNSVTFDLVEPLPLSPHIIRGPGHEVETIKY